MSRKKILYEVDFKLSDSELKKAGGSLEKITNTLKQISSMDTSSFMKITGINDMKKAEEQLKLIKQSATAVGNSLSTAFNQKLNTFNVQQFNQELKKTGFAVKDLGPLWTQLGSQGELAFTQVANAITQTQRIARKTTGVFDKMGQAMANTIRWKITSSLVNEFTGSIQQAWGYTKALDSSLNNIRIVTGKSAVEMEKFAKQANKAAKGLAASTTAYSDAALIYYQQGLSDKEANARAAVTVKAANVTGQSAADVSEQLTAVWNGYKVVAEEAELYVDKLAAVAATTAADLEELSTGMSKVASAANTMGVDIDQLSAQLATIVSVTRQDANAVGTALKTIYARMGDLKVDGVDEFGTALGDVSGQMKQMGIDVLDQQGNLRDMGEVIEEVAAKWGTWTDAQQQAAAVAIAGKRQYNNLIALFENWDMYESSLATSKGAEGTLEEQQKTYKESLKAMLQELSTAMEGVKGELFDVESIGPLIDLMKAGLSVVEHFVSAMGGLKNMLPLALGFFTVLSKTFSGTISKGIFDFGVSVSNTFGRKGYFETLTQNFKDADKIVEDYNDELKEVYKTQLKLEKAHQSGFFVGDEGEEEYRQRMEQVNAAKRLLEDEAKEKIKAEAIMGFSVNDLKDSNIEGIDGEKVDLTGNAKENIDANKQAFESLKNEIAETVSSADHFAKVMNDKVDPAVEDSKTNIQQLADKMEDLSKQPGVDQDQVNILKQYANELQNGKLSAEDKQKKIEALQEALKELAVQYAKTSAAAEGWAKDPYHGGNPSTKQKIGSALQNAGKGPTDIDTMGKIQNTAEMIGSIMAATGAISALADSIEGLANGTVSLGDGITGMLSGLGTGFLSLIPLIKLLGDTSTKAFGIWGIAITIAISLISVIVKITQAIIKQDSALTKAQKKWDEMKQTLSEMKDSAKEARQSYIDLKAELEDYRSARKGLDELRAGTEEWRNAVDQLNLQVLDLIDKYEGLELIKEQVNGKTVFGVSSSSIDKVLAAKQDEIKQRELAVAAQEVAVVQQELEVYKQQQEKHSSWSDRFLANQSGDYNYINSLVLYNKNLESIIKMSYSDFTKAYEDLAEKEEDTNGISREIYEQVKEIKEKIKEEKDDYARAIAEANGIDAEVFTDLYSKNGKVVKVGDGRAGFIDYDGFNDLVKVKLDESGKIQLKDDGTIREGSYLNVGGEIQAGDVSQVKEWLDNLAKAAYGPDAHISNYGKLQGEKTSNLDALKITLKDYGEMTIGELQQAVVTSAQRQQMEANEQALIEYQKEMQSKGWSENTAYFSKNNIKAINANGLFNADIIIDQWEEGTLDAYQDIINQGGDESEVAKTTKGTFEARIMEILKRTSLSHDLTQYSALTLDQVKGLENAITRAEVYGGGDAVTKLINSVTDSTQKAQLASFINATDFGNVASVTELQSNLVNLGININDSDWKTFFDNVNSGMKQWVEDSDKVRANLALIKGVLSEIQVGDTLSDEDYQQLISIRPELANSFIKGPNGWVSTVSGKTLSSAVSSKYSDLGKLKTEYENINTNANKTLSSGVRMGAGTDAETNAQLFAYFGYRLDDDYSWRVQNGDRLAALAGLLGIDTKDINNLIVRAWAGDDSARAELNTLAARADDLIIKSKSGQFGEDDAISNYITGAGSLSDALAPFKDNWEKSGLGQGEFRVLTSFLIDEFEAVSEEYRNFVTSERKFWDVELEAWKNLEGTPSVAAALADPSIAAQMGFIGTRANLSNALISESIAALSLLDPVEQEEDFLKFYSTAQNDILEYKSLLDETESLWFSAFDKLLGLYDKQISRYKELNSILTSSANLVKLVGYGIDGVTEKINEYYTVIVNNAEQSYNNAFEKQKRAQEIYNSLENASEEQRERAEQELQKTTQELTEAATEWVEIIRTAFSEKVSAAINDAFKTATGGYGYSDLSQAWELEKAEDERYLDEVNREYGIDSFARKLQKSIDETDNLSIQKRLNDLKERELKILEEKGKLTQYDLDRANAEYEVELKRIALEEAQQTTNKMQLTRDAMGNYTYQYVADTNAIIEAEEELAAATNDLHNLEKDRKKELIDDWFTMWTEYQEKMDAAILTGNEELQKATQDYYLGELSTLQNALAEMGLDNIFGGTVTKIELVGVDGLSDTLGNILTNTQQSLSATQNNMQNLFGEGGSIDLAVNSLTTSVETAAGGINDTATELVNNMGALAANLATYTQNIAGYLDRLAPFSTTANDINDKHFAELQKNTAALEDLNSTLRDDENSGRRVPPRRVRFPLEDLDNVNTVQE